MKKIFERTDFREAPGGDQYEWKDAEVTFTVPSDGLYVTEIIGSAQGRKGSSDDSDLRYERNGYRYGTYQVHPYKVTWRGFGSSAAFDGDSSLGYTEIKLNFEYLAKGEHTVKFFADGRPKLNSMRVWKLKKGELFRLKDLVPEKPYIGDRAGVPLVSLTFPAFFPKKITLEATAESATQKGGTDGDDVRVMVNGGWIQNPYSTSRKHKNSAIAGDVSKGIPENLIIHHHQFDRFENNVEIWYDQNPTINQLVVEFFEGEDALRSALGVKQKRMVRNKTLLDIAVKALKDWYNRPFSSCFLKHSLTPKPFKLTYGNRTNLAQLVKADPAFRSTVVDIVKTELQAGRMNGDINLGSEGLKVDFESHDLDLALHGIKRLHFEANQVSAGKYRAHIILLDIYDFDRRQYQRVMEALKEGVNWHKDFMINIADEGEMMRIVHNYEIEIHINQIIDI